jgi:hypothetical protein
MTPLNMTKYKANIKNKLEIIGKVTRCKFKHRIYLSLAAFLLYFLFVTSPMELNRSYQELSASLVNEKVSQLQNGHCTTTKNTQRISFNKKVREPMYTDYSCQAFLQGLSIQLGKANTEIQSRINQETEWFKIKYLYVGVILLGFLTNTHFKNTKDSFKSIHDSFLNASESYVTSFILALTLVVAISIDMQIRSGRIVINQLGSWIYHYAEPILFSSEKLGWESFLRIQGGYHSSILYTMTFWPNIYFLSVGLYILYLIVTKRAIVKDYSHQDTIRLGFWMLHITVLVAGLSSHIVPNAFYVTPHPLSGLLYPDFYVIPAYLIPVVVIHWIALVYLAKLYTHLNSTSFRIKE